MDQMLLAMLKANPHAFIQGNVNLVRAGAQLRMPSEEEALQVPRAQARRIVLAQNRDFAEYSRRLAQSALLVDGKNTREIAGKVGVEKPKELSASTPQDRLTLSNASIQNDGAEAALAAAREAKDAQDQLAELNKNLQDLEALVNGKPASNAIASAESTTAPTSPVIALANPNANANANTKADEKPPAQSDVKSLSWLQNLQDNQQLWAWAGAFLALILLVVFWTRRKSNEPETVYSPSYDDIPATSTDPVMDHAPANSGIPVQMSDIDLNLQTPPTSAPAAPTAPSASFPPQSYAAPSNASQAIFQPPAPTAAPAPGPSIAVDTEQSKLDLAAQLLAKGDKDLARALILSVISSASGDRKAKAIQLLGQIR
jgi:pilus assembly protein FimV